MMNKILSVAALFFAFITLNINPAKAQSVKYKCMIQMTNYLGEGAYIAISLINPKNQYEKTLYVLGPDKKWYNSLKEWHKFYKSKKPNISAITGASVTGGDRAVSVVEFDKANIDAGYKLRFESAVEDQGYKANDLEIPLTTQTLSAKSDGTRFIRYVRFSTN